MMTKQTQKGGDNSTNIQAGEVNLVQGLTYSEVKEAALDVFRANFYELTGKAQEIVKERAEQVTEDFLKKLQKENPNGLAKAEDPDFQYALFTVQKEYAKNGDKDLGDLLVDILVDRSKQEQRDILQIVLNESLCVAPKLTTDQLAALAITFILKYTQNYGIGNHQALGQYFDSHIQPFIDKLSKNRACYQHLEFSGCGSISIGSSTIQKIIGTTYQGLFLKGFEAEEIEKKGVSIGVDQRFFIPCLNDDKKLQVRANSLELLTKHMEEQNIQQNDKENIIALFNTNKMNENEIKEKCIAICPYMETLFDVWSESPLKNFSLTSVGIAIGHANIKRLVGEFSNLSIWIN